MKLARYDPEPADRRPVVGYLIPEFPGQTHIWMWREILRLREWNTAVKIFSTRKPPERDKARHAFANDAANETTYLAPAGFLRALAAVLWALLRHPVGTLRALWLGLTLPVDRGPAFLRVLPFLLPAMVLARAAVRQNVAHLHAHTAANGTILCMMARRIAGIPFSITLNANIEWWGGAMPQKFADAKFTIAITQWLLDQMKRDFPQLRPDQALLGRIGVDTDKWQPMSDAPARAAALAKRERPFAVYTVGRLHASKGHDTLIDAVASLLRAGRDITLTLIGDGPERAALEDHAAKAGLGERVRFLGSVGEDRIITELATADAFALASHAEPLGVVYMEAMSMALPTIGTSAGGVPEIIDHNRTGLLVPPRDPAALAAAIASLIDDPQLRIRLGTAARESIIQHFDSRVGAATLYTQIFGSPPPVANH